MTAIRAKLCNAQQAHTAITAAYQTLKPWLMAGHNFELSIKPSTRSLDQNAKFHAICSDIAQSKTEWAGKPRTAAQWKVLLVSGHAKATDEEFDLVPGLENEFVNLRESTALMTKKRGASLIEYALAFCAMNGIRLSANEHEIEKVSND